MKNMPVRQWLLTLLIPFMTGAIFSGTAAPGKIYQNENPGFNTNPSTNSIDLDMIPLMEGQMGMCHDLSQSECEQTDYCIWDDIEQICYHDWDFGDSDSCFVLDEFECEQTPGCHWFHNMDVCGEGSGWGGYNVCQNLNQTDCENTFFCDWSFDSMTCSEGYGDGFGWCDELGQDQCETAQFCSWDPESMTCTGSCYDFNPCEGLGEDGCGDMFFCYWDDMHQVCENGFGGYDPCQELPPDECDASFFCFWDETQDSCEGFFGQDHAHHFTDILNGYLGDYINFMDSTGYGEFYTITIENIEGGDLGDEIGLLDYNGLINFGDCSDQYGEIIVGAAVWQGEPLTITTFGAMDFCDDETNDYQQYPGWIVGNPIDIILWKADEDTEYNANYDSESGLLTWQPSDQNIPLVYNQNLDFNDDYQLDVLDVIILVNHVLGVQLLPQELIGAADINSDGSIDVMDIVQLINIILNN